MWFENLSFAPNIPAKSFTDINEAVKYAEEVTVITNQMVLGDLLINSDATIGTDHTKITRYGFEKLCSILGIPKPFARMIPNSLLFENIRQLKIDNQGTEIVILTRENGEVASIVKAPYKEPTYGEVLAAFAERPDIRYIDLGERFLTIHCAFDDVFMVDGQPTVPITEAVRKRMIAGTFIYSSIVKETQLRMISGFHTPIEGNSFICPFLGTAKANYKHEDKALLVSKFAELIRCYNADIVNRLANRKDLFKENLSQDDVARLWSSVSRSLGKSVADTIIGLKEEERKELLTDVKQWKSENNQNKLEGKEPIPGMESIFSMYKTLNAIAAYAKVNLHEDDRRDVEKISGNWFKRLLTEE